tara:strand:- start:2867 stop:3073 length:207 start_codon:yes stop_codon:yes gene_type:complete
MKSGKLTPQDASLVAVYSLAKALAISPLEIYKMPAKLVNDLLTVHGVVEQLKAEEMDKSMKDAQKKKW